MDSATLLQQARLPEALEALKVEVRQAPAQIELRLRLFGLNCVLGRWENAANDLAAVKAMDKEWTFSVQVYQSLLECERLRREVFSGQARPSIMGEPQPWLAWNVQALEMEAGGPSAEAWDLRRQAWREAPEVPARIDGQPCQWISDADLRLGPTLEACLDGTYYWIPFTQLRQIETTAPEFLAELVWVPAKLTLATGAELRAHLAARYPGTEDVTDDRLRLGQRTEWEEASGGGLRPLGQKLIRTDDEDIDFGLLNCREIAFGEPDEEGDV